MWTSKKLEEIRQKEISLNTSTCQLCLIFNHLKWQHDRSINEPLYTSSLLCYKWFILLCIQNAGVVIMFCLLHRFYTFVSTCKTFKKGSCF